MGVLGSLLIALSPSGTAGFLMAGRIVQGLSAACIMPATLALMKAYYDGKERQRAKISGMLFDVPRLIEYLSEGYTLQAGDVIVTGSPGALPLGSGERRSVVRHVEDTCRDLPAGCGSRSRRVGGRVRSLLGDTARQRHEEQPGQSACHKEGRDHEREEAPRHRPPPAPAAAWSLNLRTASNIACASVD